MKLVAKNSSNIPIEHLNYYLGNILINSDEKKLKEANIPNSIIIRNPNLNHDKDSSEDLLSIYTQIYNKSNKEKVVHYRKKFDSDLNRNDRIEHLLTKDKVQKKDIHEIVEIIGNLKSQTFITEFGKNYEKVNLIIKNFNSTKSAELSGNTLILYWDDNKSMKEYLGTIIHEYTHNDQRNFKKYELLSQEDNLGYLYMLNSTNNGYIEPSSSINGYKEQPIEKEAFDAQNKILSSFKSENNENQLTEIGAYKEEREVSKKIIGKASEQEEGISYREHQIKDEVDKIEKKKIILSKLKNKIEQNYIIKDREKFDEIFSITNPEIDIYYMKYFLEDSKNNSDIEKINRIIDKLQQEFKITDIGYKKNKNNYIRNENEIKKQLSTIARDANNIPHEHLQNYLANIFLNKEANIIDKLEIPNKVHIKNSEQITLSHEDNINLYTLLEKIPNNFSNTRKIMNDELLKELGNDQELKDIFIRSEIDLVELRKLYKSNPELAIDNLYFQKLSKQDIENNLITYLLDIIQINRIEIFQKYTGIKYKVGDLKKIQSENSGVYTDIASYNPEDNSIQIVNGNIERLSLGEIIDALLHETQHLEQNLILENKNSVQISDTIKEFYSINSAAYIKQLKLGLLAQIMYENQPIEKEAFDIMRSREIIDLILKNI